MARPTKYSKELAKKICDLVAYSSYGLQKLCDENSDIPKKSTINEWRVRYPEFSSQYANAKLKQADFLAEEILDIADNCGKDHILNKHGEEVCNTEFVIRARLRIDTRKWLASKLLPRQYGDKLILEQKNEENEALKQELMKLRAELDKKNKKEY